MATKKAKAPKKLTLAQEKRAALALARKRTTAAASLRGLSEEDIRTLARNALLGLHPDRVPFPKDVSGASAARAVSQLEQSGPPEFKEKLELIPATHEELHAQFAALPLKDLLKLNKALHQAIAELS